MGNRWGNSGNSVRLLFFGAPKSLQMVTAAMKLKDAKKSYDHPREHIQKQRHFFNKGLSSQSYGSSSSHVWMWELDYKESQALKNWCFWTVVWRRLLRVPWTSRRSNQFILKESVLGVHWKDWCWSWNCNTLATWFEELTHWERLWCWEGLWAGGEGDDRRWDGWMASLTRCIWVWGNSGSWWWTGRPGELWFMGSQRVGQTGRLKWTELMHLFYKYSQNNSLTHNSSCFWKE